MSVNVKVHEGVATIMLERAGSCNALSPQLVQDLQTAFFDVHQERRATAVVLCGAGKHFCAGTDLKVLAEIAALPPADAIGEWMTIWNGQAELLEQILRFPKPVIAAVDGLASGAGLALALVADLIVPSSRAQFAADAASYGLVSSATSALLTFRFGAAIAARMLIGNQAIDAAEAYRLGMCGEPVEPEMIWVAANELAHQCGLAPRESIQATKRLLNEGIGETLLTQLAAGAAGAAAACTTETAIEGIQAFVEKRPPNWP